jgi:hypothetical protein
VGQPPAGFVVAGMELGGGALAPNASRGNTGVFLNGRELTVIEAGFLAQLIPIVEGRYWLDANGNFGVEGSDALFNLFLAASAASSAGPSGGGNGDSFYGNLATGTSANSGGGCAYVTVDYGTEVDTGTSAGCG